MQDHIARPTLLRSSRRFLLPIWILLVLPLVFLHSQSSAQTTPLISTDTTDYAPGDTVYIQGSGFWSGEQVELQVLHADGTPTGGEGHDPWLVDADGEGRLQSFWVVPYDDNLGETLELTATGMSSGLTASTTFADNIGTNLDQLANGTSTTNSAWINGNINSTNSCYSEGRSVPYRYFVTGLVPGVTHYFTIQMEATKGGIHALDYPTRYDLSEASAINDPPGANGPCGAVSTTPEADCATPVGVAEFPDPRVGSNYTGTIPALVSGLINPLFSLDGPDSLMAYNATNVTIGDYYYTGSGSDLELNLVVTFQAIDTGSAGFYWAGHMAEGTGSTWGVGQGSASVAGAPYHMRALDFDGGGGANQDKSIQNAAICLPPELAVICSDSVCVNDTSVCRDTSGADSYLWSVVSGGTLIGATDADSVIYEVTDPPGGQVVLALEACNESSACPGDYCCSSDTIYVPVGYCDTCEVYITCPSDAVVECTESTDPANTGTATYTTNGIDCPAITLTYSDSTEAGACAAEYTIYRTWQAVDPLAAVKASCVQTITVQDSQPPVISQCADSLNFQCNTGVPDCAPEDITATDNCGSVTVTCARTDNGGSGCSGDPLIITDTYTATDECGNSSQCSRTITITDTQAPTCSVPDDTTIFLCDLSEVCLPVSASDNCDTDVACTVISGPGSIAGGQWCYTPTGPEAVAVTVRCEDDCGNSCESTFNVTFEQNSPPVCEVPNDTTIFLCALGEVCLPVDCSDADGNLLSSSPMITSGPGSISGGQWCYTPSGSETVSVTVHCEDECGAFCKSTFDVEFVLNSDPVCSVPDDTTIFLCDLTEVCLPVGCSDADGNLIGTDPAIVSGPGTITAGQWCYTPTAPGMVAVTVRCEDDCGAFCESTFNVTFELNSAPVCTAPNDTTIFLCDLSEVCLPVGCTDADGNLVSADPSLISGPGAISAGQWCYTPAGPEVVAVTIRCEDDCGAFCESTFEVTFEENTDPVCAVPNDTSISLCELAEVCLPVGCSDIDGNLVSADPTVVSGPGTIAAGQWCYTPTAPGAVSVTVRCEDECGAFCESSFAVTFELNSAPVCSVPSDTTILQCDPEEVCLPVGCSDADGNLIGTDPTIVTGPGTITAGQWCYTPTGSEVASVTVRCEDDCGAYCEDTFVVDFELNEAPIITDCPSDLTVPWGSTVLDTIMATDPDGGTLSYFLDAGPGTVNSNGRWQWTPTGDDVCDHEVRVIVSDSCGAADTCTFTVCVTNEPPTIICSDSAFAICWGDAISGTVDATDSDNGPQDLRFSLAGFDGPGQVEVDSLTGTFSWQTESSQAYNGTFNLCIEVTDGAATCVPCSPSNADTCCVTIDVTAPYRVSIEKVHGQLQGQYTDVSLTLDGDYTAREMGGYDFLIAFDQTALCLTEVSPGSLIDSCEWEYFTYRQGDICGGCQLGGCPDGRVRIVALAETNNGGDHPRCLTNGLPDSDELAEMRFLVSNDRTLECQYVPVYFFWCDCGDNTISSPQGDTLYHAGHVYAYLGDEDGTDTWREITDLTREFPTSMGAAEYCDTLIERQKSDVIRCAEYFNGGVDIICADSIDARADVNLNGVAYEIADAVMFTNYFLYGESAFGADPLRQQGSIAASDVNADGIPLSVADLVYLIRVVVGDALPYPKTVTTLDGRFVHDLSTGLVSIDQSLVLGAAWITVEGRVEPELFADGVNMAYHYDGVNTRIVVYPEFRNGETTIHGFSGDFMSVPAEIVSVELAGVDGSPISVSSVPTDYRLYQSYPNPFNPSTVISFELPRPGDVSLVIYNVAGQRVADFSGRYGAGVHEVVWEAGDLASGVYFYRMTTEDFSKTMKTVLLK